MKLKNLLHILRRAFFFTCLILSLLYTNAVLQRKVTVGAWNYSQKVGGFKNEPSNSFDILGFGSSHMYCTFNPVYLYEQTGLRSYCLATQRQPIVATHYYIKEALKTQQPEIVIVEALMYISENGAIETGVAHDAVDFFPFSLNKLRMIMELNTEDSKSEYFFPLIKYHGRWKELTKADFSFSYKSETDPFHGYVFLTNSQPNSLSQLSYDSADELPLNTANLELLLKTRDLVEKSGAKFLLLSAPNPLSPSQYGLYKSLHKFAAENHIDLLDLNVTLDATGIDNATDYFDSSHLNVFGAEKATSYIYEYIKERYSITPNNIDDIEDWAKDIEFYHRSRPNSAL